MIRSVLESLHRVDEGTAGRAGLWRLDRNERPDPLPAEVLEQLRGLVTSDLLQCYPDFAPLRRAAAKYFGIDPSELFPTNGSDAAIRMVFDSAVRPGDRVVTVSPAYPLYGIYTRIREGKLVEVPFDAERRLDYEQVRREIAGGARLCVIANPDQPTGVLHDQREIESIIETCRAHDAIMLLDEAYFMFAPSKAVSLIRRYDNLLVSRSFSKAFGIAGLRLGALLGRPELVDRVTRVRGNHEANAMALAVGQWLLEHPAVAEDYVRSLQAGQTRLTQTAAQLGMRVVTCPTNFQLVFTAPERGPTDIAAALKTLGFLVKAGYSHPALSGAIRVTLGADETMRLFCDALTKAAMKTHGLEPVRQPA